MMTEEEAKKQSNPKQERTPGPWRAVNGGRIWGADGVSYGQQNYVEVARVGAYSDKELLPSNKARWDADANHIVHCVNNFDEVVGALEELLDSSARNEYGPEIDRARAALAKAKGGEA